MAIAELHTSTATISVSEISLVNGSTALASSTADGVYQVFLDMSALATGDEFVVAVKEKATAAGAQGVIYKSTLAGVLGSPIWVSPSLILMHGWDVTLVKIAGTDRSISWSIRRVA